MNVYSQLGNTHLCTKTSGAIAVSYTHLDVYKRQVCIIYSMPRQRRGPNIDRLTTNQRRMRQRQNLAAATVESPIEHNMNHVLHDQNNTGYWNLRNEFEDNLRSLEFYECVNCS